MNGWATSRRCLFFLSVTPFYWGVLIQEEWWTIPFTERYVPKIEEYYYFSLSIRNALFLFQIGFGSSHRSFWTLSQPRIFPFNKYTQHKCVWLSMKVINHRVCVMLFTFKGPHISLCTRTKEQIFYMVVVGIKPFDVWKVHKIHPKVWRLVYFWTTLETNVANKRA